MRAVPARIELGSGLFGSGFPYFPIVPSERIKFSPALITLHLSLTPSELTILTMLTLQRTSIDGASAVAGPSRLPAQPTIIQAPTPRRARAKTRSPSYSPSDSESDGPPTRPTSTPRPRATTTPSRPPSRTERRYRCIHIGCDKAYFKPSRLKEHELTHTGEVSYTLYHRLWALLTSQAATSMPSL